MPQFTEDQFNQFMAAQAALNAPRAAPPTPATPRIGAVDAVGAWTGKGSDSNGTLPRSGDCYRKLISTDPLKAHTQTKLVIDKVKKGINGHPGNSSGLLFASPEEEHGDKFVPTFRCTVEYLKESGLEGVFVIIKRNGEQVDMLKNPGLVSKRILDHWIEDLKTNGVVDPTNINTNRAVCTYDTLNLTLSADGLLASCTEGL